MRIDEPATDVAGVGSCSSLTSSNSDELLPRSNRHSALLPAGNVHTVVNQFAGLHAGGAHKSRSNAAGHGSQVLLHSLSTNDASLGEYKYTVNIGPNSLKITGDCFDLVRVAKLVLDEYFSSSEFGSYVDGLDASMGDTGLSTPTSAIPPSHQLGSMSPFVDSGIGLNFLAASQLGSPFSNQVSVENEDDVFVASGRNGNDEKCRASDIG